MIEPMIEPIFVILGILASVAIPRLAATREDAEISAAVANLRTLVSDASAYYVAKGDFTNARWNQITNVPLVSATAVNTNVATNVVTVSNPTPSLKVGGVSCINVVLVNKAGNTPAHIKIARNGTNGNTGVCAQVLNSKPVQAYLTSTVDGVSNNNGAIGVIAIGSNTKIH